jgi:hypothetical protein
LLLCLSTPYSRRGVLWDTHRKHFGRAGDVLVWQSPTAVMNPTVPASVIDSAYEEDPASASAEFGAEFRSDLEAFVSQEAIDACVIPGRHELPPVASAAHDKVGLAGLPHWQWTAAGAARKKRFVFDRQTEKCL